MGRPLRKPVEINDSEFNRIIEDMLQVPVMTAVHSDSWLRRLDTAIAVGQRNHLFKQVRRLSSLRAAVIIARGRRD